MDKPVIGCRDKHITLYSKYHFIILNHQSIARCESHALWIKSSIIIGIQINRYFLCSNMHYELAKATGWYWGWSFIVDGMEPLGVRSWAVSLVYSIFPGRAGIGLICKSIMWIREIRGHRLPSFVCWRQGWPKCQCWWCVGYTTDGCCVLVEVGDWDATNVWHEWWQ